MARTESEALTSFDVKNYARISDLQAEQAEQVIALCRRTYDIRQQDALNQLSYPYPEALDPVWVRIQATDENVVWKVVTDTNDRVIGSGTVLLDHESQQGYVRGVMIDPEYQRRGLSGLLTSAYRDVIRRYWDSIKIFWTENRTAHFKSQKISEASWMYPVGLLPNKDVFLGQRESDLLYVLYTEDALKNRRSDVELIPEVLDIFDVVRRQFRLDPVEGTPMTSAPWWWDLMGQDGYQFKGNIVNDQYDYCHCSYWIKTGSQEPENGAESRNTLKFMINPRTQVAEKTWFHPEIEPTALKALLHFALRSLHPKPYYMECYVTAYRPEIQQVFIDLGFSPTGYIPGWEKNNGHREDSIIFTRVKEMPTLANMQLTRRAAKIVKLFIS